MRRLVEGKSSDSTSSKDEGVASALKSERIRLKVPPKTPSALGSGERVNLALVFVVVIAARAFLLWTLASATFFLVALISVDHHVAAQLAGADAPSKSVLGQIGEVALLLGSIGALTFISGALTSKAQRRELLGDQVERVTSMLAVWRDYAAVRDVWIAHEAKKLANALPDMTPEWRDAEVRDFAHEYSAAHDVVHALNAERRRLAEASRGGATKPLARPDLGYRLIPVVSSVVVAGVVVFLALLHKLSALGAGLCAIVAFLWGLWSTWRRWNSPPPTFRG